MKLKYSNTRRIVCPAEMEIGDTGTILYWKGGPSYSGRPVRLDQTSSGPYLVTTDKYSFWSNLRIYNDVSTLAIELD